MAFKMKGKSPMAKKLCGASAYKKVAGDKQKLPKYNQAFENMEIAPGATRGSSVRINPRSGERYSNNAAGLEKFKTQAKAYNAKKNATKTTPKPTPKPAPKFEKIEPKKIDKIEVKKAKPELKKALAQKALTKKEVRKTKRKAVAAKIFGDGSKRKANEANKKKRENRSVTGRMKNKASKFRRPGDM